jgi:hypothetical protein
MNIVRPPGLLRNLQIGFGLSLLILAITSIASYSSISNLLENSRRVDHTDSVITGLESVLSTLKDAETGQRGYLLTDDTSFLGPYHGARERALTMLLSIHSSIDGQRCPGHVFTFLTSQVCDQPRNIVPGAISRYGNGPRCISAIGPVAGFISVSTGPGCTRLTVIPLRPWSRAIPILRTCCPGNQFHKSSLFHPLGNPILEISITGYFVINARNLSEK